MLGGEVNHVGVMGLLGVLNPCGGVMTNHATKAKGVEHLSIDDVTKCCRLWEHPSSGMVAFLA